MHLPIPMRGVANLEKEIKKHMHNPKSYERVSSYIPVSAYLSDKGSYRVSVTFRDTNAFGATVKNTASSSVGKYGFIYDVRIVNDY